jgi:septal ring factor EnvC (AmiA/AmiB activator)
VRRRDLRDGATPCRSWQVAALLPAALLLFGTAHAQEADPARLDEIQQQIEEERGRVDSLDSQSKELTGEVAALQQKLIAAARTAQDSEEELSQIEGTLAALEEEAATAEAELGARRGQLAAILGALQRLALQPPEAMLLGPATPLDTVRGATLLKVALPAVEGRARALKAELESLRSLQAEIDDRRRALAAAASRLDGERLQLAALLEQKQALQQATESERRELTSRVALLGRQAADLRELMAKLTVPPPPVPGLKPALPGADPAPGGLAAAGAPPAGPDSAQPGVQATAQPAALMRLDRPAGIRGFPSVQASLIMPARGHLVARFGDTGGSGQASKGLSIATRPAAQVVAPYDGQVVFQGPFRGYGEILILEHAGGYHTLLAGLGRTDAIVGQWLLAGEPVGVMGPATGNSPETSPELYLELRHDGQPINPLPWLNISDSKIE